MKLSGSFDRIDLQRFLSSSRLRPDQQILPSGDSVPGDRRPRIGSYRPDRQCLLGRRGIDAIAEQIAIGPHYHVSHVHPGAKFEPILGCYADVSPPCSTLDRGASVRACTLTTGETTRPEGRILLCRCRSDSRLYADMAGLLRRDLAKVEAGIYPLRPIAMVSTRDIPQSIADFLRGSSGDPSGRRPAYYLSLIFVLIRRTPANLPDLVALAPVVGPDMPTRLWPCRCHAIILFCMAFVLAINFTRYLLRIWRARRDFDLPTPRFVVWC